VTLLGTTPWDAFTAAACVPEAACAHAVAIASLDLCARRATRTGAVALLLATLSRYEPWALAVVYASLLTATAEPIGVVGQRAYRKALALLPLVGPILWLAWNAYAHHNALHFFTLVSNFRRLHDPTTLTIRAKLLVYPASLWRGYGEWFVLFAFGIGLVRVAPKAMRQVGLAMIGCTALAGYLVAGSLSDGAPTHHAERALLPLFAASTVTVAAAASYASPQLRALRSGIKAWGVAALAFALAYWVGAALPRLRELPGTSEYDNRSHQLTAGAQAATTWKGEQYTLTPCAYEHFAWIAAFGRPESVSIVKQAATNTIPSSPACPAATTSH
jgi:hypothetical protein